MNATQTETLAELIERLRSLSIDHGPKGWPAVRTRDVTALLDRIAELEAQLEAIGAGGVSGPLMGRAVDHFPDVTKMVSRWYVLNKDGMATLWALRRLLPNIRAGISHSSTDDSCQHGNAHLVHDCLRCGAPVCCGKCCADDSANEIDVSGEIAYQLTKKLVIDMPTARAAVDAAIAALPAAQAEGWVSVDERLPQPNVEVLCAGQGWGDPYVTACYYDDERREWYQINTHWTDSNGSAQYPTHWRELPPAPPLASEAKDLT